MRRIGIILAGAALALALVIPQVAEAHGRGGHRGDRHGDDSGRYRHGHGYYHRGGRCYGCDGPGSRCDRYGCAYAYPYYGYPYYGYPYGGYYYGGYGCNFDYPCGPPYYEYDCTKYRGPDGKPAQDPQCRYNEKCNCYYHSSEPPPEAGAQPAPDQGGAQPGPDRGAQPAPDQGAPPQPAPGQGGEQSRPY
jgi:hypothetical protein